MTQILTRRATLFGAVFLLAPSIADAEPFLVHIGEGSARPDAGGDILGVAAASGQFRTFLRSVDAAGYQETLRGPGPFTVFAPTDEAFREMGQREVTRLLAPQAHDELLALLTYHVVPGRISSASMHARIARPQSANGYRLEIDGRDGLRVNDHLVVAPDLEASNGMIQGINRVLSPPVMVAGARRVPSASA